jgi:hypothetical protein
MARFSGSGPIPTISRKVGAIRAHLSRKFPGMILTQNHQIRAKTQKACASGRLSRFGLIR